jgi:hypothetical protein
MASRSRTRPALLAAVITCFTVLTPVAARPQEVVDFQLQPARLWMGVTNSDAVGTYLDLLLQGWDAEGRPTAWGELNGVRAGGSGFRGARLLGVEMLRLLPIGTVPGPPASVQIDARISCRVRGHRSASVSLWYNGLPVDGGRQADAGSRMSYAMGGAVITLFMRPPDRLSGVPGAARLPATVKLVGPRRGEVCGAYKTFGTWAAPLEEP